MINTRLDALEDFSPRHAQLLKQHGVKTLSDFLALAQITEAFTGMCSELNVTADRLSKMVKQFRNQIPVQDLDLAPTAPDPGQLGYHLDDIVMAGAFATTYDRTPELPSRVSHVDIAGPPKNQHNRGTCVAFALAGAYGFACGNMNAFSEQFLYWACKDRDGSPDTPGTRGSVGMEVLRDLGICLENKCPYIPNRIIPEGGDKPSRRAFLNARENRILSFVTHDAGDVNAIKRELAGDNVVSCGVAWFPSAGNANTRRTGAMVMPFENEVSLGGHKVMLAGYEDDSEAPGGGWFIFRNSWGENWAPESPDAPGYGRLPYAYVAKYARTTLSITELATQPTPHPFRHIPRKAMASAKERAHAVRTIVTTIQRRFFPLRDTASFLSEDHRTSWVGRMVQTIALSVAYIALLAIMALGGLASAPPLDHVHPVDQSQNILLQELLPEPPVDLDSILITTPLALRPHKNAQRLTPQEARRLDFKQAWAKVLAALETIFATSSPDVGRTPSHSQSVSPGHAPPHRPRDKG